EGHRRRRDVRGDSECEDVRDDREHGERADRLHLSSYVAAALPPHEREHSEQDRARDEEHRDVLQTLPADRELRERHYFGLPFSSFLAGLRFAQKYKPA